MSRFLQRTAAVGLVIVAGVAGVAAWLQHEVAAGTQRELTLLREERQRLETLQAENARLKSERISDTELIRLRNDQSALLRLRAEVDQLRDRVETRAKRVAQP